MWGTPWVFGGVAILNRFLSISAPFLFACATTPGASSADLARVRAEMVSLQQENARLERRVERLELQQGLAKTDAPVASTPSLSVVKLKPRPEESAPRLPTDIEVIEPSLENEEPTRGAESAVAEVLSAGGDEQFETGLKALNTGNLVYGIDVLLEFAQAHRRHPKADNALYYSGVGFMGLENLDGAMRTFQRVLEEYPAGDAVRESLMKLGECHVKRNHLAAARDIFEKVARQYKGSQVSLEAQSRLKNLEASRPMGKPSPTKQEE